MGDAGNYRFAYLAAHGSYRRKTLVTANGTDIDDMYRRLAVISLQLEELGLTHKKNQDMMLRRLVDTMTSAHCELSSPLLSR